MGDPKQLRLVHAHRSSFYFLKFRFQSAIAQMKAKDAVMDVLRDAGKSNRKETNKSKIKPVITDPVEQVQSYFL